MTSNLSSILGFYFLIFQNYPNVYAKCWIDGSPEWSFISKDELKNYTQKAVRDPLLLQKMEECFNDYDLHLWNVEEGTIQKLPPSFKPESIKDRLKEISMFKEQKNGSQVDWFSKIDYGKDGKTIFKF